MKDVLKKQKSPFEIIRVEMGYTNEEVDEAVSVALGNGVSWEEAHAASEILKNPLLLAENVAFDYDERLLKTLLADPNRYKKESFKVDNRLVMFNELVDAFQKLFPRQSTVHELAVCSYWWALYEENRMINMMTRTVTTAMGTVIGNQLDNLYNGNIDIETIWWNSAKHALPKYDEIWNNVIMYWSILLGEDSYWHSHSFLQRNQVKDLKEILSRKIRRLFSDFHTRLPEVNKIFHYSGLDEMPRWEERKKLATSVLTGWMKDLKNRYNKYTELWDAEYNTTSLMNRAGFRLDGINFVAGPMYIECNELLPKIREELSRQLCNNPESKVLHEIWSTLSPFKNIQEMIANGFLDDAERAIDDLSPEKKAMDDIGDMQALIVMQRAEIAVEKGNVTDAIVMYENALDLAKSPYVRTDAEKHIARLCLKEAERLTPTNLEQAIEFYEKALMFHDTVEIKTPLAALLAQRGAEGLRQVEQLNKGDVDPDELREAIPTIHDAIHDLKRAKKYGCLEASDYLRKSAKLIKEADAGLLGLPKLLRKQVEEAYFEGNHKNWDLAISILKNCLPQFEGSVPAPISDKLGNFYYQRARKNVLKTEHQLTVRQDFAKSFNVGGTNFNDSINQLNKARIDCDKAMNFNPSMSQEVYKLIQIIEQAIGKTHELNEMNNAFMRSKQKQKVVTGSFDPLEHNDLIRMFNIVFLLATVVIVIGIAMSEGAAYLLLVAPLIAIQKFMFGKKNKHKR